LIVRADDRGVIWSSVKSSGLEGVAVWDDGIVATDEAVANKLSLGAVNGLWKRVDGGKQLRRRSEQSSNLDGSRAMRDSETRAEG